MKKLSTCFALAAALAFGAATAATAMEYKRADALSVAKGRPKKTECIVKEDYLGRTYCFADEAAKVEFMKDAKVNIAKAENYWQPCRQGLTEYMYCE